VLLWFVGMSFLAVWLVFRDPSLDVRLVAAGALLPDVVDLPLFLGAGVAHSVVCSAALLGGVVLATRGQRLRRRSWVALPIGTFLHLVLDGVWTARQVFWWPASGWGFGNAGLPSIERGLAVVPLELAGLAVLVWAWRRFRLDEPERRRLLLRTGRLGRDLVP